MAGRERFGAFADIGLSPLQRAIRNACDLQNYEPNLALNLEVADLISTKKGNAPRDAAFEIVNLINSRNQNVALLALALLDICVKNCGYPFHLQISTKEFLNELVRRFPERPPPRPSRVQHRILESIEEWRQTICQTSRYKEDLGFIRDMHRLLLYKGYMFPEIRREDAAVLNPSDNLRSAEEMEEEEKEAQSAKLQELIRRGTPADLQEANRLMKVMAGLDNRHKTDYRAKAAEEVAKVQQKAKILEEMLQSHKPGDSIAEGDVFEELASALQSAHPKIQKMCEDESDDPEAVSKLLEINDSIHRTIERYKLVKGGDHDAASRIPRGTLGTTTGVSKNANNELSLIDLDLDPSFGSNGAPADPQTSSLENDLLGLSMGEPMTPGGIFLDSGTSATQPLQSPSKPNYEVLTLNPSFPVSSQASTPRPVLPQLQTEIVRSADPFAALVSGNSRGTSPIPPAERNRAPTPGSGSLLDLGGTNLPSSKTRHTNKTDDEWNFTSSLPQSSALPSNNRLTVLNSSLRIEFVASRAAQGQQIHIAALFSNTTRHQLSELHFQVAVEKAYTLQLRPQSSREIAPQRMNGVHQEMVIDGIEPGQGNLVKMRFKVSYRAGEGAKEEQGMVPALGIY